MMYQPHTFIFPSIVLHLSVLGAIVLLSMNAPTLKAPAEKQFRVKLVQTTPLPNQAPAMIQREKVQPQPEKKVSQPKTVAKEAEPKPEKKIEKKPEPVKKELVKIDPPKTGKNILEMPSHIKQKQKEFLDKREKERKKKEALITRTVTETTDTEKYEPVKREQTIGKTKLSTESAVTDTSDKFKNLQETLEVDRRSISSRLKSSVSNVRVNSSASGAEQDKIEDFFKNSIQTAIDSSWIRPSSSLVPKFAKCIIGFRLSREGRASNVRIISSSGYSALDESAKSAIANARFPAFPDDIRRDYLDVEVPFECEPES